ncbi:MAG: methyl-accepting chemotaxis protein, partial [Candidatus Sericytochromatia bacterium]
IEIGSVTYEITANKTYNEDNEFIGYSLQWEDVSQQVIAEQKVKDLVAAMLEGSLDKRIDTSGLSGFLENIAIGLNDILNTINEPISDIKDIISKIGSGDLTAKPKDVYRGDFISIKDAFDLALNNLNEVLFQTKITVNEISHAVSQIRLNSHAVASSSQQQSSAIEESTTSLMQTSTMVKNNADNANVAKQLVTETNEAAKNGQLKMSEMSQSMDDIFRSSEDISKIIKVIDEIAFQTNLLALNAAVEAARAGKYGKGFAVVAQEVRNLAERSSQAAKETSDLIDSSSKKVRQGVNITHSTASSLEQIVTNVIKVKDLVSEIASASDEQTKGISEVNKAMFQINQSTQSNSQQSIELASSSEELSKQTEFLNNAIQKFKLKEVKKIEQSFILPDGVTVEMMTKILQMLEIQNNSINVKNNAIEQKYLNSSKEIDPKRILP